MSTKTPTKKPASKNSALDKAAAALRKLKAASPATKKAPDKKKEDKAANGAVSVLVGAGAITLPLPIKESTEEIQTLLKKHVVIAEDFTSLRVKDETEIGEFLPIYDYVVAEGKKAQDRADKYQFVLGDLFNEGKRLYGPSFQAIMAKEGRPVSTLKKWGSISANIDLPLRNIHPQLDWSHVAEVAKVSEGKKLEILETAAKKLDAGESVTVADIREEANKHKPKKPRAAKGAKKVPPYTMTSDESALYDNFARAAEDLRTVTVTDKKELTALFPKLTGKDKSAMRETLEPMAKLYLLLA